MATIRRIGFGTVFELEDSKVGIGTDAATHTLQALGNIRSEAATDIGISSLTTYQGFTDKEARFSQVTTDKSQQLGTLSGEIVIDGDVTVSSATTFTSGPQNLTVTDTFTLPSGDTNSRELKPTPGSLRFNQDFATLEFYTGNNWATVNTFTEMQNSPGSRGRGVFFGGNPGLSSEIQFINLQSLGNAVNFGTLVEARIWSGAHASSTRGITHGGQSPSTTNSIEYVTIASTGDSIDFGDMFSGAYGTSGCSSSTRGLIAGGNGSPHNGKIGYIQIATLGNSIEFGDLSAVRRYPLACSSPTRGFFTGGNSAPTTALRIQIDTVTISSLGSAIDFGDCSVNHAAAGAGCSNHIRGLFGGGYAGPHTNAIDYITMASFGNATDFGNLSSNRWQLTSCSSQTRGIWAGGGTPTSTNTIEFVTIASAGDTQDFGDLTRDAGVLSGCSDSHGGLGGF